MRKVFVHASRLSAAILATGQIVAFLLPAQPAHAAYLVTCETGYVRTSSGSMYDSYESGYGYGTCSHVVSRIDVRLTYVYCQNSSPSSCNTTGSNFSGYSTNHYQASASGSISNLRGWYKAVVRTSFTLTSDQTFYGVAGTNVAAGSCGQSSTNYYSCTVETGTFYRGAVI